MDGRALNRGNNRGAQRDPGEQAGERRADMGWIQNPGVAASVKHGPTFSENPDNGWTVSREVRLVGWICYFIAGLPIDSAARCPPAHQPPAYRHSLRNEARGSRWAEGRAPC